MDTHSLSPEHRGTTPSGTDYQLRALDEGQRFRAEAKGHAFEAPLGRSPRGDRRALMGRFGGRRVILELEEGGREWAEGWEEEWARRRREVPLVYQVKRTSYFALDMDMEDLVLDPSKPPADRADGERLVHEIAARYLKQTAALHDERLSVQDLEGFEEGEVLASVELEGRVRSVFADEISADEAFARAVAAVEVLGRERVDSAIRRGDRVRVRYEGREYEVARLEEDVSYGDAPEGDWLPRTGVDPDPGPETRRVLLAAVDKAGVEQG